MNKFQAVLLHFGGGNYYSFQFLLPQLNDYRVFTPELPGRGRRHGEPLLTDFELAAKDLYRQIDQWLNGSPYIIYGHSMGAYLGLRLANMLEESGRVPGCLIVSGNAGPGTGHGKGRYKMDKEDFMRELEFLGGIPPEVLLNEELFGFFEPILRADFEVAERNDLRNERAVSAPIYALMGSGELHTKEIGNWERFTRGKFNAEIWDGDHFFIHHHADRLANLLKVCSRGSMDKIRQ
ncbi:MAG TPA: alpha/beta fold hydrolase [Puia sp.]|nr:alpha/beta fold hydrolase [Puia sp.]